VYESVNLALDAPNGSLSTVVAPPSPQPMPKYGIRRDVEDMLPRQGIADPEVGSVWLSVFPMPVMRLTSHTYELIKPIWVQMEKYGERYLVTDEDVCRHGVGLTIEDALRDYEEILIGYFESLMQRRDKLSRRLSEHLDFLSRLIKRVK